MFLQRADGRAKTANNSVKVSMRFITPRQLHVSNEVGEIRFKIREKDTLTEKRSKHKVFTIKAKEIQANSIKSNLLEYNSPRKSVTVSLKGVLTSNCFRLKVCFRYKPGKLVIGERSVKEKYYIFFHPKLCRKLVEKVEENLGVTNMVGTIKSDVSICFICNNAFLALIKSISNSSF